MSVDGADRADGNRGDSPRDALKRAAAEAAVQLVKDGMVIGLGTGSTAAFAVAALARRRREGLEFMAIPTSERTAAQARSLGISLGTFADCHRLDLTIDGADEVERGTLNLIKGQGGALLREKIVAAASQRLVIIVDSAKMVDRLGAAMPVPVEVVRFGVEVTGAALESLGASVQLRRAADGAAFITDGGNQILDCRFDTIADPAEMARRIRNITGVVESGLFIGRADPVFVADETGVKCLFSPRSHRGAPPILVLMGVSGSGKSSVATDLAARLGWTFQEGDDLHSAANRAKMHAGIPLTDADREPWLRAVADWIDQQRANGLPGIVTCSALKRAYRDAIIGERPQVRLIYLRGGHDLIAARLAHRQGHFMPAGLLQSQFDTLEQPQPDEEPIIVDIGASIQAMSDQIIRQLGTTAPVTESHRAPG